MKGEKRVVLRFTPKLAPITVAVLPLVRNQKELTDKAREAYSLLASKYSTLYDAVGSIGRRYRRQDEIGTPFCVTIDFVTLKDKAVTVRERDTMEQERVKIDELGGFLEEKIK